MMSFSLARFTDKIIKTTKFGFCLFIAFWFLSGNSIVGQGDISSENKSDQTLKSSARVNPSTLAMEFSLPLGAYPGRNGNSIPINLTYSSKLWETKIVNSDYTDSGATYQTRTIEDYKIAQFMFSRKNLAGWNFSLQPPKIIKSNGFFLERPDSGFNFFEAEFIDQTVKGMGDFLENSFQNNLVDQCDDFPSRDGYTCSICVRLGGENGPTVWDMYCRYTGSDGEGTGRGRGPRGGGTSPTSAIAITVFRVMVQMPDGSVVEFRKDDKKYQCGFTGTGTSTCNNSTNINGTYLSVNGSRMRFEKSEPQPNGQKRDVLYLPDGTRYLFPFINTDGSVSGPTGSGGEAEEFIDADGNKMLFDRTTRTWTDTMGRQIVNPLPLLSIHSNQTYPTSEATQDISLPSLPNTNRQAQLVWKKLKTEGCETDTTGNCGETVLENPAQELRHIGSESCGTSGWTNNANQPSLFQGYEWTENITTSFIKNYKENVCGNNIGTTSTRFNPVVLKEVILPDGKTYEFKYNVYGEISKIKYPTGVVERFNYEAVQPMGYDMADTFDQANRGVVDRWVYSDEQTEVQHWEYEAGLIANPNGPAPYSVKITAPNGSYSERLIHRSLELGYGFSNSVDGMTYEEKTYAAPDANNVKRLASRTITEWIQDGPLPGGYNTATRDARPIRTISMMFEDNKILATMSETEYENPATGSTLDTDRSYFARLNPKQTKSYHYLSLTSTEAGEIYADAIVNLKNKFHNSGQVSSISQTEYLYDADYKARGISSLPIETKVLNPNNPSEILARTQTLFDEFEFASSGSLSGNLANTWVDPSSDATIPANSRTKRGKPTTTKVWNNDENTWIQIRTQYDQYGNGRKVFEPNEAITSSRFAETEYSSDYAFAYPTKVITPAPGDGTHGTNEGSFATTAYNFTTGLPLTSTNEFGQTTATEYNDVWLRPTRSFAVNFTAPESQTEYGDTPGNLFVKVKKQIDETNWDEAITLMDNLGRRFKTQAKDSQGDVFTETKYDDLGRVKWTSNPYRLSDATKYWSRPRYDELGRVYESCAPIDESSIDFNFNGACPTGTSLGVTSFSISTVSGFVGTVVTSTDASLRKSRSITNALGQLLRVDEATATGGTETADLGTLAEPNQPTFYNYSPQGKMVKVQQGKPGDASIQYRYFLYDSLGRLIRVRQPEQEVNTDLNKTDSITGNNQWTATFTYDVLGNVKTATDANGTVIENTYDKASRVITKTYSNEPNNQTTPPVQYFYDGKGLEGSVEPRVGTVNPAFAKGKLTKVTSSVSETRYTQFDYLGRLLQMEQRTPVSDETLSTAVPRVSSYQYNFSGALIEETYPSTRVVKNEFEADGDLSRIYGKASHSTAIEQTYANSFTYTADGRIEKLKLGNNRWEWAKFNERLQVTELALGRGVTDASLWDLKYDYGELNTDGSVNTAKNTGNIAKQTLNFAGLTNPLVQTYKYDSLYRLTEARETDGTGTNAPQTWKEAFNYDRYGNRIGKEKFVGTTQLTLDNKTHPTINPATNRFNTGQGYSYDKNGNLIDDAEGRTFIFNGENKQRFVVQNGQNIGEYFYDGEGKRVKKKVYEEDGLTVKEETVFVYSSGKLVAEYSTKPLPTNPTTSYTATDQLGSPRVITDSLGNVVSRRDFMPFGEEAISNIGERPTNLKYGAIDSVRQKFTGYQKDDETGLDFAEARMYENRHGRFTAVDPLLASGKSANPQTFNRYVYVMNSPLAYTDPSGLQAGSDPSKNKAPGPISHRKSNIRSKTTSSANSSTVVSLEELRFAIAHPLIAERIGLYSKGGINISSIAGRFAVNGKWLDRKDDTREGGKSNALRHVIWTAMITRDFGKTIAQEATGAHEGDFFKKNNLDELILLTKSPFNTIEEADSIVDQINNEFGFVLGGLTTRSDGLPLSNKEIAIEALETFAEYGLFMVEKDEISNTFRIVWNKITQKELEETRKEFQRRDENGFPPDYKPPSEPPPNWLF